MKLKLFLTFDHELPLGGLKTSYEAALFEPTQKVMAMAKKLGVTITLFSDILCGYRFKDWDADNFYNPYKHQLQEALREGHDVQLHIHPHWLTTSFENNTYSPSPDFGLSHFKEKSEFEGIPGIINLSIRQLNAICLPADPNYTCIAYRAGGYNIAPSTTEIFQALYDGGIRYDSSMARGYYYKSGISEVDFRNLPKAGNWFVNPENYHKSRDPQGIFEIPIGTKPKSLFEMPTRLKLHKYRTRAAYNHGVQIHAGYRTDTLGKINMLCSSRMLTFDNHTLSLDYLKRILHYNITKFQSAETLMLSVISHPKGMGSYSFELMEGFVQDILDCYPDIEFTTFAKHHQTQQIKDLCG